LLETIESNKEGDEVEEQGAAESDVRPEDDLGVYLFGSTVVNTHSVQTLKDEWTAYLAEGQEPIKSNPLIWWAKNKHRFPRVANLARKY